VLDFGCFTGWGPAGPLIRAWLRLNHVDTEQPYVEGLRRLSGEVKMTHRLGGYCFTAVGLRPNDDTGR
jgi:hypothetical protein